MRRTETLERHFAALSYRLITVVGLWICSSTTARAETLTVGSGADAQFAEIQAALDTAQDGDTVLVHPGEYLVTEALDFNRLHDPEDPDSPLVKDLVLRSIEGAETTILRAIEAEAWPGHSVLAFVSGESQASLVAGFTITDAMWNYGVRCEGGSSPRFEHCVISENGTSRPGASGGGLYCDASSPTLSHCTMIGNCSGDRGGAVLCQSGASPTLTDCVLRWNGAGSGGGLYSRDSSPTLIRCRIEQNAGGGVGVANSTIILTDSTLTANSDSGVGLHFSSATVVNATIWGNRDAGIHCSAESTLLLTHSTVTANNREGIRFEEGSEGILRNSIVWDNQREPPEPRYFQGEFFVAENATVDVQYTCIRGDLVWSGIGNINADPLFARSAVVDLDPSLDALRPLGCWFPFSVEAPDLRLRRGSPAIDRGLAKGTPASDLAGNPRRCGRRVDMGAYESCDCNDNGMLDADEIAAEPSLDVDADGTPDGCEADCNGNAVPDDFEIATEAVRDCDGNGVPDSCDGDCNQNGVGDGCDIAAGASLDCNENGTPDECEVSVFPTSGCTVAKTLDVGFPGCCLQAGSTQSLDACLNLRGVVGFPTISQTSDRAHFAHQTVTGNFELTAEVTEWSAAPFTAELGLMVRESNDAGARNVFVFLSQRVDAFQHRFAWRSTPEGRTRSSSRDVYDTPQAWLRIERRGDLISGRLSLDGENWTAPDTIDLPGLPEEVHVGIASSHVGVEPPVATVCNVSFKPSPAAASFIRGDCDGDGSPCSGVNDALVLLNWLFLGRNVPPCLVACDPDSSGTLNVLDAIHGLNFCLVGAAPPGAPFPDCGPADDSDRTLSCATSTCR